ncbi:hypothetical protein ANO11243_061980 [Dothideomycetidae sp. 11243]|nr:hypothetical protein ANO11243_061980 [fungal sp. No.11243]
MRTLSPSSSMAEETLSADELQLRAQGHKGELPRQFGAFATLSLAFSMTNSWVGYSAVFATPLLSGGGPTMVFGLLAAMVACSLITAGLAELASAFPTSGGQYHYAFMVSSPSTRASTAFTVGWLSVVAWCLTAASACIYCAQLIVNLAAFDHLDYLPTQWQVYLIYVLLCVAAAGLVTYCPRQIPQAEQIFFLASVLGFVAFFIAVLAASPSKQSAEIVFTKWDNQTGWNDGVAFMLGVGTCMYTFLATDGAAHVAEEMPNPGRGVPRAMGLTMLIGIITSLLWALAFMFSVNDFDTIASSPLPILVVLYQAFDSTAGTLFCGAWILFVYFGATIACFVTAGRLTWAFARDNGLPYSTFFARTHPTLQVPANATFATLVFCVLYGLIYIGSTTAFNSFISLSILGLNVTYTIPQAIAVFRGRDKVLPADRYLNLGPVFGPVCNVFSTAWMCLYTVLFCFPNFVPPTLQDMNYLSVVVVGVCVFVLLLWFVRKRKTFVGPAAVMDGLHVPMSHESTIMQSQEMKSDVAA